MSDNSFKNRIVRASKLDPKLYEEVEADKEAMGQAIGIVILSSIAGGLGLYNTGGLGGIIVGIIVALIGWYIWASLTCFIGTKLLPEKETDADLGELLRTIGFSSAPGILRVFGIFPGVGKLIFSIASIWMLVAMVVAVRQALDYKSTLRAFGVCVIGYIIQILIIIILMGMFG